MRVFNSDTSMEPTDSSQTRTVLDIVWSALATITICTWTILHLNVPKQRQGRDPGWWGDIKWSSTWRYLLGSILTVLAPEMFLVQAANAWWIARKQLRLLHAALPATKETWGMTHMLFAQMGGFVVEYSHDDSETELSEVNEPVLRASSPTSIAHDDDLEDGTHASQDESENQEELPKLYYFTAESLRRAIVERLLPIEIPPADEILDRSKSSFFTKLLTLGQVLWFVVTFCARWARGLPILQLELGVLSFVICAAVTYLFVLAKPKDVRTAITLKRDDGLPQAIRKLPRGTVERMLSEDIAIGAPIASDVGIDYGAMHICMGAGVLIGAVHLAGWNLDFPTMADTWLWRSAALGATTVPIFLIICMLVARLVVEYDDSTFGRLSIPTWFAIFIGANIAYLAGRIILLVEMFRCLTRLPPGALDATWTEAVPHIG